MNDLISKGKNQNIIKILRWILLLGSSMFLVKVVVINKGYYGIINNYFISGNFDPPLEYGFTTFMIFAIIEIFLGIIIFLSALNLTKYRETWRKILVFGLGLSIIIIFITPKIIVMSILWSILFAIFSIIVITYLSNKEVRFLFK